MPTTISASFFPHIIDSIFELAPLDSLLHLRVCRDWKRRVAARLYHVRLTEVAAEKEFPMMTTYALEGGAQGPVDTFETTSYGKCDPPPPRYLCTTAVIDLHAPTFKVDMARLLASAPADATYRLHQRCNLWSTATWRPRSLVLFCKDPLSANSTWSVDPYGLAVLPGCDKLVFHIWHGRGDVQTLFAVLRAKNFKHIVIMLRPKRPQIPSTVYKCNIELLQDVGVVGYAADILITFVVCDARSEDEESWPLVMAGCIRGEIMQRIQSTDIPRRSAPPKSTVRLPLFMTEAEYREEVGDEQFEIEMDDGRLSPPAGPWPPHAFGLEYRGRE